MWDIIRSRVFTLDALAYLRKVEARIVADMRLPIVSHPKNLRYRKFAQLEPVNPTGGAKNIHQIVTAIVKT